jgi:predicted ATPase
VQEGRPPLGVFVGRAAELARAAEVIATVQAGQPWLVTIEGDPGVGKTALARHCLVEAAGTGLRVLSARADQAEADLDFGLVDQLLRAAGRVSRLVAPAGGTGSDISSFAVGARLLEVVGEQAASCSVAIFIDDLQWTDRKSVEALTFVLRRL